MTIDKKLLGICERAIMYGLGGLGGIPSEVANTVCNVYYRFFHRFPDVTMQDVQEYVRYTESKYADELSMEEYIDYMVDKDNPFAMIRRNIDALEGFREDFQESEARSVAELGCINNLIDYSRQIRRRFPPHLYKLLIVLIIDIFKYGIKNAFDKSPLRRKVERRLKRKRVDEIPNLIDLMDVRKRKKAGYKKT